MFLAAGLGESLVGMGLLLVGGAWMMHRAASRRRGGTQASPLAQARKSVAALEQSPEGQLAKFEARLHDQVRELEGRMVTRIAQLTQLVAEADAAALRLEQLLDQAKTNDDSPSTGEIVSLPRPQPRRATG